MRSKSFLEFAQTVERRNFVVLDTETTGLRFPAEIIEIAIIDPDRKVLLDTRVKPKLGVPEDASAIHGILDRDLESAPTWAEVRANVLPLVSGKDVIIYNASYDFGMLHNSDRINELPAVFYNEVFTPYCAMLWFAEWWGDWNDYRGSYRWQKLTDAADSLAIPVVNAHGALGDCLMTIKVIEAVLAELADNNDL